MQESITYGAMMIAMFAIIIAVSIYIPLIGGLTIFFIPLPIILYRLRYERGPPLLVMGTGVLVSMLVGGLYLVPVALVFGLLGFVIGRYKKTKSQSFIRLWHPG